MTTFIQALAEIPLSDQGAVWAHLASVNAQIEVANMQRDNLHEATLEALEDQRQMEWQYQIEQEAARMKANRPNQEDQT